MFDVVSVSLIFVRCFRDRETTRDEFIFYSKRLMRLLVERSLALMPFTDTTVETPQGVIYHGKSRADSKVVATVHLFPQAWKFLRDDKEGKVSFSVLL